MGIFKRKLMAMGWPWAASTLLIGRKKAQKAQRGLRPQPIYLSRRHRDTEKDSKAILRELRASVRDNLTYYLIGTYRYSKNKTKHKKQEFE